MSLDHAEVRSVIKEVLAEQQEHVKAVAHEAVAAVLVKFGIHEDDDPKEIRADFQHLRKWRKSVEQAQSLTFKTVVGTIAAGFVAAVWMGFKVYLGK
jgi:hypothetical protein